MSNTQPELDSLSLSGDQLASFERDGFVVLPDRFGADEVADVRPRSRT